MRVARALDKVELLNFFPQLLMYIHLNYRNQFFPEVQVYHFPPNRQFVYILDTNLSTYPVSKTKFTFLLAYFSSFYPWRLAIHTTFLLRLFFLSSCFIFPTTGVPNLPWVYRRENRWDSPQRIRGNSFISVSLEASLLSESWCRWAAPLKN